MRRNTIRLIALVGLASAIFTPICNAAPTPPFAPVWVSHGELPYASYRVFKNTYSYIANDDQGAIRLSDGKQIWEECKPNNYSLIVSGGDTDQAHLYSLSGRMNDKGNMSHNVMECRSIASGKVMWSMQTDLYPGSLIADGGKLYCDLGKGAVVAINASNGRVIWQVSITTPRDGESGQFTYVLLAPNGNLYVINNIGKASGQDKLTTQCLSKANGKTIWVHTEPYMKRGGCGATVDSHNLYETLDSGKLSAFSLKTGKLTWSQPVEYETLIADTEQLITTNEGSVSAFSSNSGHQNWTISLTKRYGSRIDGAEIIGTSIYCVADSTLYCLNKKGQIVWKWTEPDMSQQPPIIIGNKLLMGLGGSIMLLSHGNPPPLPKTLTARRALAQILVDRIGYPDSIDELNPFDEQKLLGLGDDAFPLVKSATKKWMMTYLRSNSQDDFDRFDGCSSYLGKLMKPEYTPQVMELERIAESHKNEDIRQVLLRTLPKNDDSSTTISTYLNILHHEQPYWGSRNSSSSLALTAVLHSTAPAAKQYLISAIGDPSVDPYIRHKAYVTVATSCDPQAIQAILLNQNTQRTSASLETVLGLSTFGTTPNNQQNNMGACLLSTATDAKNILWGLVASPAAGSGSDLWIVRYDGNKWVDPTFTNLTPDKFGNIKNFIKYVQYPTFTRDTDGDGWTDLLEQRVCTDPNKADTDGDGLIDSKDKNPLSSRQPKTEVEQVIAAAFHAHFWYPRTNPSPCLVVFPKGITPFELCGSNWVILGVTNKTSSPLSSTFDHGTAFVDFQPPMTDFDNNAYTPADPNQIVLFNKDHMRARLALSEYYGRLNGTVDDIELKKFGNNWIVVSDEMKLES